MTSAQNSGSSSGETGLLASPSLWVPLPARAWAPRWKQILTFFPPSPRLDHAAGVAQTDFVIFPPSPRLGYAAGVALKSLTPAEWYLLFTVVASILSQLPNLNFIAWSVSCWCHFCYWLLHIDCVSGQGQASQCVL
ncbi:unnamed protein product [Prunus armeniaca]